MAAVLVSFSFCTTLLASPGGVGASPQQAPSGGSPFGSVVMVNDNKVNEQSNPVIVRVPGQGLFVAWQDMRSGDENIYTSISRDNGATFSPSVRADDSTGTSKQTEPAAVASSNGTIYLVWQDNRRSTFDFDIFFAKSYNGGATWTRNIKADDSNGNTSWQERPAITVTSGGTVYVAWTDDRAGALRIRGAYSTDGGDTFSASSEIVTTGNITSGQTGISLASYGNRIYAAFMDNESGRPHPYLSISTNGGKSFTAPVRLDNTGSSGWWQRDVAIATVPKDGIVAVWSDSRNGDWDIYASLASSTGTITKPDFRVDDDTTRSYQLAPCVAADQLGDLYVAWQDERNSLYAIRYTYTRAGNYSFVPSVEVSTPKSNDFQRSPSIVATEPGRFFVAWQDDRAGTYDIYSCMGYYPNFFEIVLIVGWNYISIPFIGYSYMASTLGLRAGDLVSRWSPSTQKYDMNYVVGTTRNDFAIEASTGYWVYATVPETLRPNGSVPTTIQLKQISVPKGGGWVSIGFDSFNSTRRADDLGAMYSGAALTSVAKYIPSTGGYTSHVIGSSRNNFVLSPGEAYWVWVTDSGTFSYTP